MVNLNKHQRDEFCDLECRRKTIEGIKGKKKLPELPQIFSFNGPVRVVVVDSPDQRDSERRRTVSGFISLANMMMAGNIMIVILFSFSFIFDRSINFHVLLCSIGFQFCLPLSILIVHPLYGPAGPMDESRRIWEHNKILILGIVFMSSGVYFGFQYTKTPPKTLLAKIAAKLPFNKYHRNSGIAAFSFFLISIVIALILLILKKFQRVAEERFHPKIPSPYTVLLYCHRYFGMLTLVLSNVCYIIGIITPSMQILLFFHGYLAPTITIVLFTLFYTVVIIAFPGWHYTEEN